MDDCKHCDHVRGTLKLHGHIVRIQGTKDIGYWCCLCRTVFEWIYKEHKT